MLLSILILTKNEAVNLPTCLASLLSLEADVYIVDSGSTDETVEISNSFGCQFVSHPFVNHAEQINWALENLPIRTPWIFRLDADEHITRELARDLPDILAAAPDIVSGFQVKRRVFFMGKWIRHGGYYPTWLLRIWRTGLGTCEQRWMDEHIVLSNGEVANLKHDIIDENKKGLAFWIDKHNCYADREVQDILAAQSSSQSDLLQGSQFSQAKQRRWVKKVVYARFPLFARAFAYWLLRYICGLGFLALCWLQWWDCGVCR